MRKTFAGAFIVCIVTLLFQMQAFSVQEDTAELSFSKTAVSRKNVHLYTVEKGDVLSAIIRRLPGITEKDVPVYYEMTRKLNPDIRNLDRLSAGQTLVLPGKSPLAPDAAASDAARPALAGVGSGLRDYRVKKGDTLIHILRRELGMTTAPQKALRRIQSLNPSIRNVNRIYAGQKIVLPDDPASSAFPLPPAARTTEIQTPAAPEEPPGQDAASADARGARGAAVLSPAARLAVLKHIVTQMKGNMITSGNYYLPVSKTEQLTIDCSVIPVVELDNRTTIFLDLEHRSNRHLKKIIGDHWNNYHLVAVDDKDDIIVIMKKIFQTTKTYEITKAQTPLVVGSAPALEILVDWIITPRAPRKASAGVQGIRFVYEASPLLPRAVVNAARQHAAAITEISPASGLAAKAEELYALPPLTTLPAAPARDFSYALLSALNIPAQKDTDVQVFNIARDGFNLSVKADLSVVRGDRNILIFSRPLPTQFIGVLEKAGYHLIFIADEDEPSKNMEKILRGLGVLFTAGYFSFSGRDMNQPPYEFGFTGTKIRAGKDIYAVDFDFNPELRGLLQEYWSASVIRY
ncbi:MAG: LysM peptidoglycan-binding domain-containing protein [Syntrophaceae bacterium]|nr:LysM peptidoglycan-binding domain-containing protein [Syntrophaceae bacterium]